MKYTKRKAFNFLRSYFDVLNKLQTDEDKLLFLMSIINKQFLNEEPGELKFPVDLAYDSQINAIDNSVKGWLRAAKTDLQGKPLDTPPTPPRGKTQSDPKEEEVQEEEKEKVKRFMQPTILEISTYMTEKNYPNEAERFFDFYTSKGWMVGKNKMKDWKAAVRNWCRDKQNKDSNGYSDGKLQY